MSNYAPAVESVRNLPKEQSGLTQSSFRVEGGGCQDVFNEAWFKDTARLHTAPYCNLRGCNQSAYPFIYLVVTYRNRPDNLRRYITSIRDALFRCSPPPEWYKCLCIYVVDFASNPKTNAVEAIRGILDDRIRIMEVCFPFL